MPNALRIVVILSAFGCFHAWKGQTDYYVHVHRLTVDSFNKSYLKDVTGVSYKLNRKEFAYNISLTPLIPITKSQKLTIRAQAFKKLGPDYRLKLIDLSLDLCDSMRRNFYQMATIKLADGSAATCPVAANKRFATYNQKIDGSAFPPNIPAGSYKLLVEFMDNAPFFTLSFYGDVIYKERS